MSMRVSLSPRFITQQPGDSSKKAGFWSLRVTQHGSPSAGCPQPHLSLIDITRKSCGQRVWEFCKLTMEEGCRTDTGRTHDAWKKHPELRCCGKGFSSLDQKRASHGRSRAQGLCVPLSGWHKLDCRHLGMTLVACSRPELPFLPWGKLVIGSTMCFTPLVGFPNAVISSEILENEARPAPSDPSLLGPASWSEVWVGLQRTST
ncbi:hypothetical protein EWB00_000901 [Schistosoma japonicum]|uniref:Uncharacterized protein n=1 Tax=Schistosoma japonicum TaxID=6182 RepID=A0A4Z2CK74_SCHJA|nr:hypothetical protein EWB00_000901 [Schistosoma japonicum]